MSKDSIKQYGDWEFKAFTGERGVAYAAISDEDIEAILTGGWEIIHVSFNNNHGYIVQCKRKSDVKG